MTAQLSRGNDRTTEDECVPSLGRNRTAKLIQQNSYSADTRVPTTWRSAFAAVRNAVEDEARAHRSTAEGLERLLVRLNAFRDDRVSVLERLLRPVS